MEAIAEFVLVVVGILLALQIQNWNQDRQDRNLEKVLLNEMLRNLQSDLNDMEANLSFDEQCLRSIRIVIDFLESNQGFHDSLGAHFANMKAGTFFMANTSAFESLLSVGIDLIRNDSIRQQITYLYSVTYPFIMKLETHVIDYTLNGLNPLFGKYVRPYELYQKFAPLDPQGIKRNNDFFSGVVNNLQIVEFKLSADQMTSRLIRNLTVDIEKELKK